MKYPEKKIIWEICDACRSESSISIIFFEVRSADIAYKKKQKGALYNSDILNRERKTKLEFERDCKEKVSSLFNCQK